jgi:hypothetical protein
MTDTLLEGDHPRINSAKFGGDWLSSFTEDDEILIGWFSSKNVSGGSALRPKWPPQPNLA